MAQNTICHNYFSWSRLWWNSIVTKGIIA